MQSAKSITILLFRLPIANLNARKRARSRPCWLRQPVETPIRHWQNYPPVGECGRLSMGASEPTCAPSKRPSSRPFAIAIPRQPDATGGRSLNPICHAEGTMRQGATTFSIALVIGSYAAGLVAAHAAVSFHQRPVIGLPTLCVDGVMHVGHAGRMSSCWAVMYLA